MPITSNVRTIINDKFGWMLNEAIGDDLRFYYSMFSDVLRKTAKTSARIAALKTETSRIQSRKANFHRRTATLGLQVWFCETQIKT
jgi:hypothetical protein